MRALVALALALSLTAPAAWGGRLEERLTAGDDHYFNLEHDEALRAYYDALALSDEKARIWNHIATTLLYQELTRLGKLETSAFRGDNEFLEHEKPDPDRERVKAFLGALQEARRLAEQALAADPNDPKALLSLSANHALEANYLFMIEKSHFSALRSGNRARDYADRLIKIDPDLVDAYLVPGVQEYIVGSLPWAVKALVALGGVRGNKDRGQEWVTRVAAEGDHLKTEARVLMTLLHRRESRPLEAAKVLEDLIDDYPRNYVLRLELGSMYLDAGEKEEGLKVFRTAKRMVERDEQRYGRMPKRLRDALDRKIDEIATQLSETRVANR